MVSDCTIPCRKPTRQKTNKQKIINLSHRTLQACGLSGDTMFDIFEVQRERKILIAMEVIDVWEKTVAKFNDLDT